MAIFALFHVCDGEYSYTTVYIYICGSVAEDLSVVTLAAKLDQIDRTHVDRHKETNSKIVNMDQKHR